MTDKTDTHLNSYKWSLKRETDAAPFLTPNLLEVVYPPGATYHLNESLICYPEQLSLYWGKLFLGEKY